ncbi:PREDICTED: UPF0481 protein At3g47200-like [Prunus mume]|uniref:UPF0481 protein At3g47200-like n=1 Tax=Prunus mume TaxID=102107 RepID=A0ABM1LIG9_PRUMU|nr:PREDICTED: UPF0481 protein At3g47200-like [Prunus mume]
MENGIQGSTRDHTSVRIVDEGIGLEALEKTMSKKLCPRSPSWAAKCCIFRVPPVLKRHKPDAYEPDFISIGPFHRGGKQFQHMENVKQWYLNNLLSRRNLSLKHLIDHIVELEQSAREFYAEPLDHLSQNDMVEMMILDGCFLIELFRKYQSHQEDVDDPIFRMDCMFQYLCHDLLLLENQLPWFVLQHLYHLTLDPYKSSPSLTVLMLTAFTSQKPLKHNCDSYLGNLSLKHLIDHIVELEQSAREFYAEPLDHLSQNDMVEMMILDGCFLIELFRKYQSHQEDVDDPIFRMDCMFQYLCHDLLLLENQLPWFVLQHLYHLTLDPYKSSPSLTVLMLTAFTSQKPLKHNCDSYLGYVYEEKHDKNCKTLHILDLIRTSIVFPFQDHRKEKEKEAKEKKKNFPPATALSEAGVKFRSNTKAGSIMNIEFEKGVFCYFGYKRGTFEIPHLSIGELTDPLFRNLIAFEQCYHHHSHEITSYAFLMDKLIASSKDMEFLCDKRIIDNWLSAEDGAKYFSKLCNDTVLKKFYYEALCEEVNMHYKVKWYRWLEKLNRDYFANPWSVISLIAAAILLALTVVQTVYTIRG